MTLLWQRFDVSLGRPSMVMLAWCAMSEELIECMGGFDVIALSMFECEDVGQAGGPWAEYEKQMRRGVAIVSLGAGRLFSFSPIWLDGVPGMEQDKVRHIYIYIYIYAGTSAHGTAMKMWSGRRRGGEDESEGSGARPGDTSSVLVNYVDGRGLPALFSLLKLWSRVGNGLVCMVLPRPMAWPRVRRGGHAAGSGPLCSRWDTIDGSVPWKVAREKGVVGEVVVTGRGSAPVVCLCVCVCVCARL